MVTPLTIRLALGFCCKEPPFEDVSYDSEAGKQARKWLEDEGLIDWDIKGPIKSTQRLEAWVRHLCNQPIPEQHWIVPKPESDRP
jgi:hypothetical protein